MEPTNRMRDVGLVIGVVIAAAGVFFLASNLGLVPAGLFDLLRLMGRVTGPLALIVIGCILIVLPQRGGLRWSRPTADRRLYRSRSGRIVAGVCGGLAAYLGIDPALARLGYALVALVFGVWQGVVVYVVLTMVVPEEPVAAPV
jgi:phage shock protein C